MPVFAQKTSPTTVKTDSTRTLIATNDTTKKAWTPNPRRALLWSIIPGAGQMYNRKLWYVKAPIVWGSLTAGVLWIGFNKQKYDQYQTNLYQKANGLALSDSLIFQFAPIENIRAVRDFYNNSLQQSYLITGVLYLLQALEAFTAAHLMNFDVSENLSFRLQPNFSPVSSGIGIGATWNFNPIKSNPVLKIF
jgi:hypothetical protein